MVSLDDLPQGLIRPSTTPSRGKAEEGANDEAANPTTSTPLDDIELPTSPAYPTVVLQARRNMQKFDNCVLLTRVGGFYELYFDHAEEYGPLLNLKVAQKKTAAGPVPMVNKTNSIHKHHTPYTIHPPPSPISLSAPPPSSFPSCS